MVIWFNFRCQEGKFSIIYGGFLLWLVCRIVLSTSLRSLVYLIKNKIFLKLYSIVFTI